MACQAVNHWPGLPTEVPDEGEHHMAEFAMRSQIPHHTSSFALTGDEIVGQ